MFWMIVNLSGTECTQYGEELAFGHRPKFMHQTREKAETELLRLQAKCPHDEFILLESVARAVPKRETVWVVEPILIIPF